ncbi:MAG: AraC family transcriptional regulator [Lachnospiraceae bacterium]|nr:AraC family transcriptional regulator [Lachnospiraceae bacterium]
MSENFLDFTISFFNKINLHTLMISITKPIPEEADLGLRKEISKEIPISILDFNDIDPYFHQHHIIYICTDQFLCNYILIPIPDDTNSTVLFAGPFLTERTDIHRTTRLCNQLEIPPILHRFINQYFSSLPCITEQTLLENYLYTFGENLYGPGLFQVQYLKQLEKKETSYVSELNPHSDETLMKRLEERYQMEGQLIDAISRGDFNKAMHLSSNLAFHNIDNRSTYPLRSVKNNLLTFNTICRKGAELGNVHPVHLDEMSRRMAIKIENMTSPDQDKEVHRDVLKNYCHMVQQKTTTGFSPTMQRVMNHVFQNITDPTLTLQTTAQALSLSKTYLSALFKKETNCTFTTYINQKRIEHGIFLLNTTNLQIQEIAGECGFLDVNYFTRIFQKEKHMTPSQYRRMIQEHS